MKSLWISVIFAAAFLVAGNSLSIAQTPEQLYQRALVQEEGEGKLEEAINLYSQIADNSDADQSVRAKALLHIGMCYERMGTQEAVAAYQRLVTDFPTQKNEVAIARERLNSLIPMVETGTVEPEGITIKQIWKEPNWDLGTVSFDGRFRSCIASEGWGDLAIHNLTNGEMRTLTHEADSNRFVLSTTISKNGKQIAYNWWNPYHTYDLCLVDVDNPVPRLLYQQEGVEAYPVSWLSDNELIMSRYIREKNTTEMVLLNISDNSLRVLKPFDRRNWPQIAISPDTKFIAFDFISKSKGGNSDINLLPVDGGEEISLINHPANDRVIGWVPGRNEFLFISDRSGSWDLWAMPLGEGKQNGQAKRIYTNIGEINPRGFTESGDCYFGFSRRGFNAYLKAFNVEKGEVSEKQGETLLGSNFWVKWSPDGQFLLFIKEDGTSENPWQLTVRDITTGQERSLAENLFLSESPCWSPDGKSILVLGIEKIKVQNNDFNRGIYLVDVETGLTTEILQLSDYKYKAPDDDSSPLSDLEWSADGKSFYYLFFKDRLVKHDLESGTDKVLYEHSHFDRNLLSRSPDGKSLLFATRNPKEEISHIYTMPAEGGKATELCTSQEAYCVGGGWSPDGRYIFYTEATEGTSLWRVSVRGGIPQKVWQSENRTEFFRIHPNGKQIAFSIREKTMEVRVIENLGVELSKVFKKNE